jgi:ABC-type amino acid transport substrate-binding protein
MSGRMLFIAAFTVYAFGLLSKPLLADEHCRDLKVAAAKIPHFIESEQKGVFIDLIRAAALRSKIKLVIKVYPKKRALRLFTTGQADALIPHSSAGAEVPSHKSTPILVKRDFAFVRNGTPIPESVKDLEGLHVGLTSQYAYPKTLTSNTKITFVRSPSSDVTNIRMLSAGRFQASIIEERSGLKAISEAGVENVIYDRNHPVNELQVWMLFGKSRCGKTHVEKMNAAFAAMKSDGQWKTIMKAPPNSS